MDEDELLENEQLERMLSPHPFSLMKYQSLCIFLIIWGAVVSWFATLSPIKGWFGVNEWIPILVWGLILLLIAVFASLFTNQWSIFIMYLAVFMGGLLTVWTQNWFTASPLFIPLYSLTCAIIGFLLIEAYRRSHKYFITNQRIVFISGIVTKKERSLRYDKIIDPFGKQGIFGRIFGFGSLIPVTGSGVEQLSTGETKKGKKSKGSITEGKGSPEEGIRSVYELHGVYPYKEIKKLIQQHVHATDITPYQQQQVAYQKEQVSIQKQMKDLMKKQMMTKTADTQERKEPNESTPKTTMTKKHHTLFATKEEKTEEPEPLSPEQVDIQKQMKELLKKQEKVIVTDDEEPEPEEEEEETDEEKKEHTS